MSEGSGVAKPREQSTRTFFDRFAGRSAEFVSRAPLSSPSVSSGANRASTSIIEVGRVRTLRSPLFGRLR